MPRSATVTLAKPMPMSEEDLIKVFSGNAPKMAVIPKVTKPAPRTVEIGLDTYESCYCAKCDSKTRHLVVTSAEQNKLVAVKCEMCGEKGLVSRKGLLGLKAALIAN
jgi:hypothetical protein